MNVIAGVLILYVLVALGALAAILWMDLSERTRHHRAALDAREAYGRFLVTRKLTGVEMREIHGATPKPSAQGELRAREALLRSAFPMRLYAEDDDARRWLREAAEQLSAIRKAERAKPGQGEGT